MYIETNGYGAPNNFNNKHRNDYFDLIVIFSEELDLLIEDGCYRYQRGDICLLNRNVNFTELFNDGQEVVHIGMTKEFLMDWPNSIARPYRKDGMIDKFFKANLQNEIRYNKDYIDLRLKSRDNQKAKDIIMNIVGTITAKESGYEFYVYGLITKLFSIIENRNIYERTHVDLGSSENKTLAESVKRYIDNRKRRVTRIEISDIFHYSEDYLGRIFKKYTGYSIKEYCQKIYIVEAKNLLINYDVSITDIATILGFENRTQFYRVFKDTVGMTPQEFRNNHKKPVL